MPNEPVVSETCPNCGGTGENRMDDGFVFPCRACSETGTLHGEAALIARGVKAEVVAEMHNWSCDTRACLQRALEEFQSVLVAHCVDPTQAEIFAIRAHAEALRNLKVIGRQPMRFGGD